MRHLPHLPTLLMLQHLTTTVITTMCHHPIPHPQHLTRLSTCPLTLNTMIDRFMKISYLRQLHMKSFWLRKLKDSCCWPSSWGWQEACCTTYPKFNLNFAPCSLINQCRTKKDLMISTTINHLRSVLLRCTLITFRTILGIRLQVVVVESIVAATLRRTIASIKNSYMTMVIL